MILPKTKVSPLCKSPYCNAIRKTEKYIYLKASFLFFHEIFHKDSTDVWKASHKTLPFDLCFCSIFSNISHSRSHFPAVRSFPGAVFWKIQLLREITLINANEKRVAKRK
jgi:hypothetical protein